METFFFFSVVFSFYGPIFRSALQVRGELIQTSPWQPARKNMVLDPFGMSQGATMQRNERKMLY